MGTFDRDDTALNPSVPLPAHPAPRAGSRFVTAALVILLAGGVVGAGTVVAAQQLGAGDAPTATLRQSDRAKVELVVDQTDTDVVKTPARIYAENAPSTVTVCASINVEGRYGLHLASQRAISGFVLTEDGYVATNYRMVADADSIQVMLSDGTVHDAVLVGHDEDVDLAVLKVETTGLVPVVLGDSDALMVGEPVCAIGDSLSAYPFSLTTGIVNGPSRSTVTSMGYVAGLIQTSVDPSTLGCPLFNDHGEVVGMINLPADEGGICFAFPINGLVDSIEQIIETGTVAKPFVGVYLADVTPDMLEEGLPAGALISGVFEGGAAEKAGVQVDDVVTDVDGRAIGCLEDFSEAVAGSKVGDVLKLEVRRGGETVALDVTVGERSQIVATAQALREEAVQKQQADRGESWGGDLWDLGQYRGGSGALR